jgi:hypothetical protein
MQAAMMTRRADIFAAIERTGTRRGGLREWMRKNHDAFAEKLKTVRPNWDLLAEVFAEAGLTDQRGNLPTKGETIRKTWQRVRREMQQTAQPAAPNMVKQKATPGEPVVRAVRTRPAQGVDEAPRSAGPKRNRSMDDVLSDWDARRSKMPEPLEK